MEWFRITDSSAIYVEQSACGNWRIRFTRQGYTLKRRGRAAVDTPLGRIPIYDTIGTYDRLGDARAAAVGPAVALATKTA